MKFLVGQGVKVVKTASYMDGMKGIILGRSSISTGCDFYIVGELSVPLTDRPDKAFVMIEHCLVAV